MTKKEIAEHFRVHQSSVQRWIDTWQLVGGEKKNIDGVSKWVFKKQDILNYLERQK